MRLKQLGQAGFDHVFMAVAFIVVIGVGGSLALVLTHAATAATPIVGIDSKCLYNNQGKNANGNKIELYSCNGKDSQKWTVDSNGEIVNANGRCIQESGSTSGSSVVLYTCKASKAQEWAVNSKDTTIVNNASGLCLDDQYANTANGNPIWVYTCNGTHAQMWKVTEAVASPAPTVSLSASPTSVTTGSTSTLTWSSTNATTCTASGSWSGTKATSGSMTTGKLTQAVTYDLSCTGAGGTNSTTTAIAVTAATTPPPTTTGTLEFDDEFTGAAGSSPDTTKWNILNDVNSWGVQCFVNDRSHIYLNGDGQLVETATYNPSGSPCSGTTYESGGMDTKGSGQFSFQYGTIEASIKVPCESGTGMWPAFWSDGPGWPANGEIDYLEIMDGKGPDDAKQSLHGPTSSGSWNLGNDNVAATPWCGAYHTYGATWSDNKIAFTIDGVVTHTDTSASLPSGDTWPFDKATALQSILLDLQVGKDGGTPTPSTFPQSMDVDWVRVYKN
jgi:beta-glucanase (GH16 family)